MPTHKPTRAAPGMALVMPRTADADEPTQRAFDQVALIVRQLQGLVSKLRADVDAVIGGTAGIAAAPYFDTVIDMTGTPVSFGAAYDQWNVGALGHNTLIKYITDGTPSGSSSRAVRGLAGGSNGKTVTFMNMAPAAQLGGIVFAFEDPAGGAFGFHNAGGATVTGNTLGCVSYYYDGGFMWRHYGGTQ